MDAHFKGKSYRPTEDEDKGHKEGKWERRIKYHGLQTAEQGFRHYCFKVYICVQMSLV